MRSSWNWLNWTLIGLFMFCGRASATDRTSPLPGDPLTASIHSEDAERFARLFTSTHGKPSPEQIQKEYLDGASYGVTVFIPNRIQNAARLAEAVAANPALYEHAIQDCLPRLKHYDADLRAIYLALHGLYPEQPLPQIYVVFGAGNSGGTAGPNAQVLGLEVICKISGAAPDGLKVQLRNFFAHETVHTFQTGATGAGASPLLANILTEGGADFVASVVTGENPDPERAAWAAHREQELWAQLQKDILATKPAASKSVPEAARDARHRWVANYNSAPQDWPSEVGYWVGMRIWQCYYNAAADKHQAMHDVLNWNDPELILRNSGYSGQGCSESAISSQAGK